MPDRQAVLSAILLWFAAAAWLLLVIVLGVPLVYHHDRFTREARSPASLTAAAGTAVLGTRLIMQDHRVAAAALLAVAAIAWALFLTPVARVWTWVAFTVTVVVLAGLLRRARQLWPGSADQGWAGHRPQ